MRIRKHQICGSKLLFTDGPEIVEGLPSRFHLMGKPLQDEELVRIVEIVDEALRKI